MLPLKDQNPTRRTPFVTIALILLNVGVFFLVQPSGKQLLGDVEVQQRGVEAEAVRFNFEYAAIPCEVTTSEPLSVDEIHALQLGNQDLCRAGDGPQAFPDKRVWLAVLFSMFLHGSLIHLGGNMLFLWIFGNNIEDHLGAVRFVAFYLLSGVVATAAHVAIQPDSTIPLVGASGAVAGVMGAYLVWFPNVRILTAFFVLFIFLRDITAKWLLGFWFVSQFFINPNEGVAWMAHVGGFVFGVAIGAVVRASRAVRRAAWRPAHRDPQADPWSGRRW